MLGCGGEEERSDGLRGVVKSIIADLCITIVGWVAVITFTPVSYNSVIVDTRALLFAVCSCPAATQHRSVHNKDL